MKEYTQEMRENSEPCPYCGFWHSAASHPPQFANLIFQIQSLEEERDAWKRSSETYERQDNDHYMQLLKQDDEITQLRADLAAAVELINHMTPDGFVQYELGDECIACHNSEKQGHTKDCKYMALFARLEGEPKGY